jgi:NAD-dependent dihydropyrimidine dehydrogenase PreA subunit
MAMIGKPDRGTVDMNSEECKGCGLCVEACPARVLVLAEGLNRYGYRPAVYAGRGCTGCGICFSSVPNLAPSGVSPGRRLGNGMQKQLTKAMRPS